VVGAESPRDAIDVFSVDSRLLDSWGCSFQSDLCGMTPVVNDGSSWQRNNTLTQNPDASDNWYIALMGIGTSSLETPRLAHSETSPRCLSFYYYINGANPGALSVIPRYGSGEPGEAEWTQGRPQGDEWLSAYVDILFDEDVSVIIEGERLKQSDGIIAIDEMNFRYVSCDVYYPTDKPENECKSLHSLTNDFTLTHE
ncbi:hypothetical protein SK128_025160, partial [Halocaridina rubra]